MSGSDESASPVLDLRTYTLAPGGGAAFDHIFRDGALQLHDRLGIQVVSYGTSLDNDDHYYLMRSFQSAAQREAQLDSFYGSDQWRQKYRDPVLALSTRP